MSKEKEDNKFVDMVELVAQLKTEIPFMKDFVESLILKHASIAKVYKSFYDELIKSGFSKQEALELIKVKKWYEL